MADGTVEWKDGAVCRFDAPLPDVIKPKPEPKKRRAERKPRGKGKKKSH
jgi:hypothetical protein